MRLKSTYAVKKWDEKTYLELPPHGKATRASVQFTLKGDLTGLAEVEYLMHYSHFDPAQPHNSTATYLGLMSINAALNGEKGSFFLEDHGSFKQGAARSTLKVVKGSGAGVFKDIQGIGSYTAGSSGATLELEVTLK